MSCDTCQSRYAQLWQAYEAKGTWVRMYLHDTSLAKNATPILRKIVRKGVDGVQRVYVDAQARPFAKLGPEDLLDTQDVCRLTGCSVRSVYRWVMEQSLKSEGKVGREFLFKKRDLLRWHEERPRFGRPLGT